MIIGQNHEIEPGGFESVQCFRRREKAASLHGDIAVRLTRLGDRPFEIRKAHVRAFNE